MAESEKIQDLIAKRDRLEERTRELDSKIAAVRTAAQLAARAAGEAEEAAR